MVTRLVDRKVPSIVATNRRLTATITADAIANNPHPALVDQVGGVSAFFLKNSISHDSGAKGPDTPRQGAVVGFTHLLLELWVA